MGFEICKSFKTHFTSDCRELWLLMDLDDSLSMSLSELDKGISTITQSHDFFDCYPAVLTSYEYTRNFARKLTEGEEEEENANEVEFHFDINIRHYYSFSLEKC